MLSIVIPTLNAGRSLGACFGALASAQAAGTEIVISDGGSDDETKPVAEEFGARWIEGAPGRGGQLARGAATAAGEWLLFLHGDTVLAAGWHEALASFAGDAANWERAAYFRFRLADDSAAARRLETLVSWRCQLLALPYGDQGLVISRRFYDSLGGYRDIALMEDVDLVRRIGRRRLVNLAADATTSAIRYKRRSYSRRMARNASLLLLYYLGVAPTALAALYEK